MGNLWLKLKIWTKGLLIGAVLIYALLFLLNNSGQSVTFWYWFSHERQTSMLVLVTVAFLAGGGCALLIRTTFTTIKQVRELRTRNRIEKLERSQAEIKAKAAMLQTRTSTGAVPPTNPSV